jgi:hypothetical protein
MTTLRAKSEKREAPKSVKADSANGNCYMDALKLEIVLAA